MPRCAVSAVDRGTANAVMGVTRAACLWAWRISYVVIISSITITITITIIIIIIITISITIMFVITIIIIVVTITITIIIIIRAAGRRREFGPTGER